MDHKNYYYALGLSNSATPEEVKSAYRKLSLKFHPDQNNGDPFLEEMFKQINEAHEVLSNPVKRQRYDASFSHMESHPMENPDISQANNPGNNRLLALDIRIRTYLSSMELTLQKKAVYYQAFQSPKAASLTAGKVVCCFFIVLMSFVLGQSKSTLVNTTNTPTYEFTTTKDAIIYYKANFHSRPIGRMVGGTGFNAIKETRYFVQVNFIDSMGNNQKGYILKDVVSRSN